MRRRRFQISPRFAVAALCAGMAFPLAAREWSVGAPPADFPFITPALAAAADGDTIRVAPGVYREDLLLDHRVALVGVGHPTLIGSGRGTVIRVTAPACEIRGFTIADSGQGEQNFMDAGILLASNGNRVAGNRLFRVFYGIVVEGATKNEIRENDITGLTDLPFGRRGDGIYLYRSPANLIADNRVRDMRDAIYLQFAPDSRVTGNEISDSRYGLHDMYSNRLELTGNSFSGSSVGANIMNCREVHIARNRFARNRGIGAVGLSFKECDNSLVEDNDLIDNGRGLQVDGASNNRYVGNRFYYNDTAIQLFASAEQNLFSGNTFRDNLSALLLAGKIPSTRWSENGRGNYWAGYEGFDFDGDGMGDQPWPLLGVFERIEGNSPVARLFLRSPAAAALTLAGLRDAAARTDATDPAPLLRPPGGAFPKSRLPSATAWIVPFALALFAALALKGVRPC